jgi:hypothetical protein
MIIHDKSKLRHLPAGEIERRSTAYQVRWVARHCRVNLTTAATLTALAGFSNRREER